MKSLNALAAVAAAALLIGAGAVMAKEAKTAEAKVHTPESIECSKQADAKGLHGKERQKFRSECKKQLKGDKAHTKAPDAKAPPKT